MRGILADDVPGAPQPMDFGSARRRVRSLHNVSRWLLTTLLLLAVAGVIFMWWLFGYRSTNKVPFSGTSATDSVSSEAVGKKPSPLGSGTGTKVDPDAEPLTPPLAIPPSADLGGGNSALVLPGNSEVDSSATEDNGARLRRLTIPWPIEGQTYRAQHKKGFGGCWGELLLRADRLVFNCEDNPRKSLSIVLSEVKSADDDGIEAADDKYHFELRSASGKRQVHQLFDEWIKRSRLTQSAR